MQLPFTEQQFLDVFGAYNAAAWPVAVALWLATVWYSARFVRGHAGSVTLSALGAAHWAWSGLVYHAGFFTRINPAAWLFAALFLLQAVAFVWLGIVSRRLVFEWRRAPRHAAAIVLIAYSLAYPFLVLLSGHEAPRAPLFAVPCPTALFTAGLLLTASRPPILVLAAPTLWALVGGTAALSLGMLPDLMLFPAAVSLVTYSVSLWIQSR
jgi:Family of unknown function (DUF6064)